MPSITRRVALDTDGHELTRRDLAAIVAAWDPTDPNAAAHRNARMAAEALGYDDVTMARNRLLAAQSL